MYQHDCLIGLITDYFVILLYFCWIFAVYSNFVLDGLNNWYCFWDVSSDPIDKDLRCLEWLLEFNYILLNLFIFDENVLALNLLYWDSSDANKLSEFFLFVSLEDILGLLLLFFCEFLLFFTLLLLLVILSMRLLLLWHFNILKVIKIKELMYLCGFAFRK